MEMTFAWMAWTTPIAIFFVCIFLMLAVMTVWELRSPTVERKGFMPMRTTRGDRLFIGLLTAAYINRAWGAFTEMSQWIAAGLGLLALIVVMAKA